MRTPVQIKICGLTRREDVENAIKYGADYLGFVLVPSSPRFVPRVCRRELISGLPEKVKTVAVVADLNDEAELAEIRELFDIIQFHGQENPEHISGPGEWKAVTAKLNIDVLEHCRADCLVIDSDRGGGSGHCCDWDFAARMAEKRKIILAGGLTPENVSGAIEKVHSWGVDVSSGVEISPGIKSEEKIRKFISEIKK